MERARVGLIVVHAVKREPYRLLDAVHDERRLEDVFEHGDVEEVPADVIVLCQRVLEAHVRLVQVLVDALCVEEVGQVLRLRRRVRHAVSDAGGLMAGVTLRLVVKRGNALRRERRASRRCSTKQPVRTRRSAHAHVQVVRHCPCARPRTLVATHTRTYTFTHALETHHFAYIFVARVFPSNLELWTRNH